MKIVGVTSCTVGIAHTYMSAEAIEKYFRKLGHEVKIERDSGAGPENVLTNEEIKEADVIILACSGDLYEPERFDPYQGKSVSISVYDALRKPNKIQEMMIEKNLYKEK
jgi:fructose-specific phosphotransferase system IIB component